MGGGKKMTRVILRISRTDHREWRWRLIDTLTNLLINVKLRKVDDGSITY